jgi:hypothetical protein
VAIEHDPAVPAGQPVLVALGAKVPRALVSASVVGMTPAEPVAARREASAATPAPEEVLQLKVTTVVPATTPTMIVCPGTCVPAPVTVMLHGKGGVTSGVSDEADALPTEASVRPATIARADAPTRADIIDPRRVGRNLEFLNGFLMEAP